MDIDDLTSSKRYTSRILNALWHGLYPRRLLAERESDWRPTAAQIRGLDLHLVHGLGHKGRRLVETWYEQLRD